MTYTLQDLSRLIAKHNFCILATQGRDGPHVSGVGYFARGLDIYIPTNAKTVKARNLRRDPRVAVHIPVPWPMIPAPPRSIQFRGNAQILPIDDSNANTALKKAPMIMRRVYSRLIKNVNTEKLGERIWVHARPKRRIETFLVGVSFTSLFGDESKAILHFEIK